MEKPPPPSPLPTHTELWIHKDAPRVRVTDYPCCEATGGGKGSRTEEEVPGTGLLRTPSEG